MAAKLELLVSETEIQLKGKFAGKEFLLWVDVSTKEYTLIENDLITHQGKIGENQNGN